MTNDEAANDRMEEAENIIREYEQKILLKKRHQKYIIVLVIGVIFELIGIAVLL